MTAPFVTPEHCLRVAFAFQQMNIEPKNATAVVIDSLKERLGLRTRSDMTQHDWHAQAVMALSFAERILSPHPMMWEVVLAEYSWGIDGAKAVQAISEHVDPDADNRFLADMIVMRSLRGKPSGRMIAASYGVSRSTVDRATSRYSRSLEPMQKLALEILRGPMQEVGLIRDTAY